VYKRQDYYNGNPDATIAALKNLPQTKGKKIAILGSTGSIGTSTLKIIKQNQKIYDVVAIAANSNIEELEKQANIFKPKIIAVFNEKKANDLKKRLSSHLKIKVISSLDGLIEIVTLDEIDFVMMAIQGSIALKPTIEAIKAKKVIGLANKEVLVAAGDLINKLKKEHRACIIPVDSEHSAIFQCLKNENENENLKNIKRLILTASGGPFLNVEEKKLKNISLKDALTHPNFSMGAKITVDSSTMMNKGLEIIEAYHLFDVKKEDIDVIVHPEQIIHSMVEFQDSSILAQMSEPTMDIPISYALSYPKREKSMIQKFDFIKNNKFTFYEPDLNKFLCLKLAKESLKISKSMPCFMNMANEVLVKRFLKNEISWLDISKKLEKLMSFHSPKNMLDLKDILDVEEEASKKAITT